MSRRQKKKLKAAVPFNPADVANVAKSNPYIHRLLEDAKLRDNVQKAVESSRSAYERLTSGKTTGKAILEDKKLQGDVRQALEAVRDATIALTDAPKKQARKGRRLGRRVLVLGLGAGLAMVGSEKLRSKVLDTLFGAEEEFQYTPPPAPTTPAPAETVSAT